jgi:hypothetical protein
MNKTLRVAAVLLLLASPVRLRSQDDPGDQTRPDYSRAIVFFHHFQDALRRNDRDDISKLIQYPLLARLHNKSVRIQTRKDLIANFDAIFDRGVRCAVAHATDSDVWGNSHGFSVGTGAIWFDDFSPPGTNDDVNAPDFWTKGTFLVMTVNNEAYYQCKAG